MIKRLNDDGDVEIEIHGHTVEVTAIEWAQLVAGAAAVSGDEQVVAALDLHAGVPVGSELALAFRDDDNNQGVQRIETPSDGETLAVILRKQNPTITETTIVRRNVTAWVKA